MTVLDFIVVIGLLVLIGYIFMALTFVNIPEKNATLFAALAGGVVGSSLTAYVQWRWGSSKGWLTGPDDLDHGGTVSPSPRIEAFIKGFETCRLSAFKPTPYDQWTCGWGATGPDINADTQWNQQQADDRFDADMIKFGLGVTGLIGVAPTTQDQYDAMISLAYNIGDADLRPVQRPDQSQGRALSDGGAGLRAMEQAEPKRRACGIGWPDQAPRG